jgi:hypothetical protein
VQQALVIAYSSQPHDRASDARQRTNDERDSPGAGNRRRDRTGPACVGVRRLFWRKGGTGRHHDRREGFSNLERLGLRVI